MGPENPFSWTNYKFHDCKMSFSQIYHPCMGFPGGASGKESDCQCRRHKKHEFNPWVGKILWRRAWKLSPVFLPGKFHGQRSLMGDSPWGSPGKHTGVGFHALLQGTSLTQGSNPWFLRLLHWQAGSLLLVPPN